MKMIDGDRLADFELEYDEEARLLRMLCGCSFKVDPDSPDVNGHPSLFFDQEMNEGCRLVWAMFAAARTTGVFQLESNLGKQYAKKLMPETIDHLGALVALLRPGVLKVKGPDGRNMAEVYCDRKNGLEPVAVEVPQVADILEPTYGVVVYQEQHSAIARRVANFDKVEVDVLRKVVGKKKMDKIAELGKLFVDKAEAFGVVTKEQAEYLFDIIRKSGRYAFNKSHSIGYALSTFETGYAKCHFPHYFFTSYLDGARDKMKPLEEIKRLVRDMRHFGIEVLPPRFLDLEPKFSTDCVKVRFGLANVGGIGERSVAKIVEKLERDVLLTWTWFEFLTLGSALCGSAVLQAAVKSGAMDDYDLPRRRMLEEMTAWGGLTEREQAAVTELGADLTKEVPIYRTDTVEVTADEPVYDKAEMKAYKEALKAYNQATADWLAKYGDFSEEEPEGYNYLDDCDDQQADSPTGRAFAAMYDAGEIADGPTPERPSKPEHPTPIGHEPKTRKKKVKVQVGTEIEVIDEARPASTLEEALENLLLRPNIVKGARREKVESILDLLRNPPSPLVDTPYMKSKQEAELMGVALTASNVDAVDKSIGDTTVRDYLEGADAFQMTIVGEVQEYFERTVKTGNNAGRNMANLVFYDGENVLEDVVVFTLAWEKYANLLMRPGAVVAITGKRNWNDGKTFVVNEVRSVA